MSDFDKEAEREKLREKYERDQEKRQSTQRMSELLLKGATMTNRHCEECGDPIFRYDGQEFCPTCQQAAQQGGTQTSDETGTETNDETGTETNDGISIEPNDETDVETSASDATAEANGAPELASTDSGREENKVKRAAENAQDETEHIRDETEHVRDKIERVRDETKWDQDETERVRDETRSAGRDVSRDGTDAVEYEGDLTAARVSLVRSIERYARAAEQTDDPRRAKAHLAAAREAAEALNALDR